MGQGIDTAYEIGPKTAAKLRDMGYTFAGRYIVASESATQLDRDEALAISGAGLYVFSICQRKNNVATYFTSAQGTKDAEDAIANAKLIGQPNNTPIYFVVDFDASLSEIERYITPYMQAVVAVLNGSKNTKNYKFGVYGSKRVCNYYKNSERFTFLVDNSWGEGAAEHTDWNLRQYQWNIDIADELGFESIPVFLIDKVESSPVGGGGWQITA